MHYVFVTYCFSSLPDKLKHHVQLISQATPSRRFLYSCTAAPGEWEECETWFLFQILMDLLHLLSVVLIFAAHLPAAPAFLRPQILLSTEIRYRIKALSLLMLWLFFCSPFLSSFVYDSAR